MEDNGEALPIGKCFTLQQGEDVTLISWGASLHETQLAAKQLRDEGISCEIIDVATIKPLDIETILASVEKLGVALLYMKEQKPVV